MSQRDARGTVYETDMTSISADISHEMTHALVNRTVGNLSVPTWFDEGCAQLVSASIRPYIITYNDQKTQKMAREGSLLSLEQVADYQSFQHITDLDASGAANSSAYAQSLSMMRYLTALLKGVSLHDFLDAVRNKNDFDAALQEKTGLTKTEFYNQWLASMGGTASTSSNPL